MNLFSRELKLTSMAKTTLTITRRDGEKRTGLPVKKLSQYMKINRLAIEKNKFQIDEVDDNGKIVATHTRLAEVELKSEMNELKTKMDDVEAENEALRKELEALKKKQKKQE